jgi:hypothetical protein
MPVVILILGALISCAFVQARAQVNFSPTWGKRGPSIVPQQQNRDSSSSSGSDHLSLSPAIEECKLPFDGAVRVLRLIQVVRTRGEGFNYLHEIND